jgi:F-type H+-transporting ATPase subunit delta
MAAVLGRYARAYAEVIVQHKLDADAAVAEIAQVAELIDGNRELHNVLENPAVPHQQKLHLLDAIMKRMGGSKLMRNFLAVLIDNRRIGSIGEVVEQFRQELDRIRGIAEARVSSARALTAAQKKSLEAQLSAITGKLVRATYSEDPALLGGVTVRVGSTIYDGSVQGRLERMRREIAGS